MYWVVFVLLCAVVSSKEPEEEVVRGCRSFGRCCQGRDATCYVSNRVSLGQWKSCYCDADCVITGDCCADYDAFCKPANCTVSRWSRWNSCSKLCGRGHRNRTRSVVSQPMNGGQACPRLTERQACTGHDCNIKRDTRKKATRETGRILPIRYARFRTSSKYDIRRGIRRNLYERYHSENSLLSKPTYCAQFEIVYSRVGCRRSEWAGNLTLGSQMCVECQSNAMHPHLNGRCKGDGVSGRSTRWSAVNVGGCSGWWKLVGKHRKCECDPDGDRSFIFV